MQVYAHCITKLMQILPGFLFVLILILISCKSGEQSKTDMPKIRPLPLALLNIPGKWIALCQE